MLRFYKVFTVLCAGLLLLFSSLSMANSRGEQKQVFGDYEVHYIGLTSSFLSPETAQAYGIQRSRTMGFLSISVLDANKKNDLAVPVTDRKSTRLNSSHVRISYAVFCLKKKNTLLTMYMMS